MLASLNMGKAVKDSPTGRQTRKRLRVWFAQFTADDYQHLRFTPGEGKAAGGPQARPVATGQRPSRRVNEARQDAIIRVVAGNTFPDLILSRFEWLVWEIFGASSYSGRLHGLELLHVAIPLYRVVHSSRNRAFLNLFAFFLSREYPSFRLRSTKPYAQHVHNLFQERPLS